MNENEFKRCTRGFALRVVALTEALPRTRTGNIIAAQLMRAGTSVGANYRAACRAKSPNDMLAKLAIVEEETDESIYWIELLVDAKLIPIERVQDLLSEANQILAMIVASIRTLRNRSQFKTQGSRTKQALPTVGQSKIQNPKSKI